MVLFEEHTIKTFANAMTHIRNILVRNLVPKLLFASTQIQVVPVFPNLALAGWLSQLKCRPYTITRGSESWLGHIPRLQT